MRGKRTSPTHFCTLEMEPTTADKIAGDAIPALAKGSMGNWKQIQERTFTNWFNDRLRGHLKVGRKQVSRGEGGGGAGA